MTRRRFVRWLRRILGLRPVPPSATPGKWAYPTDDDILAALCRATKRRYLRAWERRVAAVRDHSTFDKCGRDEARGHLDAAACFFDDLAHLRLHQAEGYGFVEFPPATTKGQEAE